MLKTIPKLKGLLKTIQKLKGVLKTIPKLKGMLKNGSKIKVNVEANLIFLNARDSRELTE